MSEQNRIAVAKGTEAVRHRALDLLQELVEAVQRLANAKVSRSPGEDDDEGVGG